MGQGIEALIAVVALLAGLFAFVHGMTMEAGGQGHIWAIAGLGVYLVVWAYGIIRASYS